MIFEELKARVELWGLGRGIVVPDNARVQLLKTMAELGELADATIKNDRDGVIDGLGDVLVTLILYAKIEQLDLVRCLETAWNEIRNRTGNTIDGVFIKD